MEHIRRYTDYFNENRSKFFPDISNTIASRNGSCSDQQSIAGSKAPVEAVYLNKYGVISGSNTANMN